MSTSTVAGSGSRARVNIARILIILILGMIVLWYFGAFARRPRVALVTSSEQPYWDLVIRGAQEAAAQYEVQLTVVRCKPDPDAQAQSIRGLLGRHFDGIAVSPVNPLTEGGVLADVAGVTTLVTFDSDSPYSQRLCFVGTDNYAAGRLCGQQVRQAIPGGGEVIIAIGTLDKENAHRRRQGVIDELLDRPFEPTHEMDVPDLILKGKNYTVVDTLIDGGDAAKAVELAAASLKQHPRVKCLVGLFSFNAPALLKALEQAGKLGKVSVVGFDADKDTLAGIEAGTVYASVIQDQFGLGFHTVRILAESARHDRSGLPMFQRRTLPVEIANKDNVAAIRAALNGEKMPSTAPTTATAGGI